MKTTLEIPDPLFRRVKARAAERGQSLKELVTEALQEKLAKQGAASSGDPPWMSGFGALRNLRGERARIESRIADAFERIEPEDET
jgi:hypothetical protein